MWQTYDEYTKKFEMALVDEKVDDMDDLEELEQKRMTTRAFGVLNNAWLGFKPSKKLLYVLDDNSTRVNREQPIVMAYGH